MKTNREKNIEHDQRQQAKVRPKQTNWNPGPLSEVVNQWIRKGNEQT
jgi:hypothetical protein